MWMLPLYLHVNQKSDYNIMMIIATVLLSLVVICFSSILLPQKRQCFVTLAFPG